MKSCRHFGVSVIKPSLHWQSLPRKRRGIAPLALATFGGATQITRNTKVGSIIVALTSCLTDLESAV
jgi:hypothetical protein